MCVFICMCRWIGETCNTTNVLGPVTDMDGKTFTNIATHPPTLFRMLGEYREAASSQNGMAICMAILSAFAAAVTYCVIRKLGHGVDGLVCVNYFAFISTVCAGIGAGVQGLPLPLHPEVWGAVVGMGVAGFLGQCVVTIINCFSCFFVCLFVWMGESEGEGKLRYAPSIHPSIHPSVHPSIHPSINPSIHPSIHPFGVLGD